MTSVKATRELTTFCMCVPVEFVNMRSSQVNGKIPTELGRLGKLETLLLEGNWLSGTIPNQLGNLVNARKSDFIRCTATEYQRVI